MRDEGAGWCGGEGKDFNFTISQKHPFYSASSFTKFSFILACSKLLHLLYIVQKLFSFYIYWCFLSCFLICIIIFINFLSVHSKSLITESLSLLGSLTLSQALFSVVLGSSNGSQPKLVFWRTAFCFSSSFELRIYLFY